MSNATTTVKTPSGSGLTTFAYDEMTSLPRPPATQAQDHSLFSTEKAQQGRKRSLVTAGQHTVIQKHSTFPSLLDGLRIFLKPNRLRFVFSCTQIPFLSHSRNGSNMKQEYFGHECLLKDSLKVFC